MGMIKTFTDAALRLTAAALPWVLLALALVLFPATFTRCTSFKPIIIEGEPELSTYYTTLKFYSKGGVTDSAFLGIVYTDLRAARELQRQEAAAKVKLEMIERCRAAYYGDTPVDKKEYDKFLLYTDCIGKQ